MLLVFWFGFGCNRPATLDLTELQQTFQTSGNPASNLSGYVGQEVAAAATNGYEQCGQALQRLRQVPGLTAEQLTAVQSALRQVQRELARRAEAGDQEAELALQRLTLMPGR